MGYRAASLATFIVIRLLLAEVAFAQIKSGTITGSITDATGAALPDARVILTQLETNIQQQTNTNSGGEYSFPYLANGRYAVAVDKDGFNSFRIQDVTLGTAQTIRVDAKLTLRSTNQTVEVTAAAPLLQSENAEVSSSVNTELINSLPNANNNPLMYATLQPGVVARSAAEDTQSVEAMGIGIDARRALSAISINGGQAFANDITLDGVSIQGSAWNEATVLPNRDGLQEVRTSINSMSAEYGRGQGVISMTTRSGTNQFHGTLSYQNRNEAFFANSFGNNAQNIQRLPFKAHQYGGTIGGPIIIPKLFNGRNKAFFFVSYEGLYHNRGISYLRTVPTAMERAGDFSETYIAVNGVPKRIEIYDPFVVSAIPGQSNAYRRALVPNARIDQYVRPDGSRGIDPFALRLMSAYPLPNRTPDAGNCGSVGLPSGCLNQNNYLNRDAQEFRRNNVNSRLDFRMGRHSPYVTFGISRGHILTPRTWGDDVVYYDQPSFIGNTNSDNNPYGAIGDTIVLSPALVLDIRYGLNRINSVNEADTFKDYDYRAVGIPASLLPLNGAQGAPVEFSDTTKFSRLNSSNSLHKQEHQTNHVMNASITNLRGKLSLKLGGEGRVYLSNYIDPEESFWIRTDAAYTREQINATGGGFGATPDANQAGFAAASLLLGGGYISVAEGRSIRPALAQKYLGLYSQNDWRATSRLTLNLGVRWDFQPGPTERYDQISSIDFTRKNPYGTYGVEAFPGVNTEDRHLWRSRYSDIGPRAGFAFRIGDNTVLRGGYGLMYLPSNTGFYDGTYNYGAATFSTFTDSAPFGDRPAGQLVGRYYEVNRIVPVAGGDPAAPANYGGGTPRFDYTNWRSGAVQQWNFFIQRSVGRNWSVAAGYVGTKGDHLPYDGVPVNSAQYIEPAILSSWRDAYLSSNGSNPASAQVANPFQPDPAQLIPFKGNLGRATLSRLETLYTYPHLSGLVTKQALGFSRYNALQVQANRRFAAGFQVNAHYTWSKSEDMTKTAAQSNQGYDETGGSNLNNLIDYRQNKKLSLSDTPHRLVVTGVYDLPFGAGRRYQLAAAHGAGTAANALLGGWRLAGNALLQSGFPLQIDGLSDGSLNARPDRIPGVPIEVPAELQHWYDGSTTVTLPSGRLYTPAARTFLKYNPDAFRGRIATTANGSTLTDVYWYGNAAITYNDIRSLSRQNYNLSLTRTFRIGERWRAEFMAQGTNILNHAQFRPGAFTRALGATSTSGNAARNIPAGTTTSNTFGTMSTSSFEPRHIELQLKLRF